MNVLSLFDGMSCGQIALRELGIKVDKYFASEIDKYAIAQTQLNFPETIQLGNVTDVRAKDLPKIDLLLGGSPCQGFSFAGRKLNFNDPRSALFFEFVRILNEIRAINPDVIFLLENVRMKREYQDIISAQLGLRPVLINSARVSAQNRERLYWSNIRTRQIDQYGTIVTSIPQPEDLGLFFRDIMEEDVPENYYLSEEVVANRIRHKDRNKSKGNGFGMVVRTMNEKSTAICIGGRGIYDLVSVTETKRTNQDDGVTKNTGIRRYTPTECSRLQTIPEWYRWECSNTQKYKMLGNGWTVKVIMHILQYLKEKYGVSLDTSVGVSISDEDGGDFATTVDPVSELFRAAEDGKNNVPF